jgi:hypothetical protein
VVVGGGDPRAEAVGCASQAPPGCCDRLRLRRPKEHVVREM